MIKTGPDWVCTRSPVYMLWLLAWCFSELPAVRDSVSLTLLPVFCDSFPPIELSCPASVWVFWAHLIVFYFVLFGFYLLEAWFVLKRKWKWCRSQERECRGSWEEGREGKMCLECILWEKNLFSIKTTERIVI